MAKTLVIKLAETVDNDNLRKLGEMRIFIVPYSTIPDVPAAIPACFEMKFTASEPFGLELEGNGYFTDSTLTQNLGKTYTAQTGENTIYVSDSTSLLRLANKYAITSWDISGGNSARHYHWTVDGADFAGMGALTFLRSNNTMLSEGSSLACFSKLPNLTQLHLSYMDKGYMNGSLSDIAGLTNLVTLNLFGQENITGNLSDLSGMTHLQTFWIVSNKLITGNLSSLAGLTELISFEVSSNRLITGDISSITGLTKLYSFNVSGNSNITGDISSITGLTKLYSFDVSGNPNIPGDTSSIAHLHPNNGGKLATLNISNTGVTGTWPPSA